jgi:hypothetical protein
MDQQVEHLRLHGDALSGAPQLAPLDVKHMIIKEKLHLGPNPGRQPFSAIIGGFSVTNQASRKVFRPGRRHPACHADGDFGQRLQTESAMSQTQEIGRDVRQDVRQGIRQDIRRRRDGSIDVDFYRARAAVLRTQAIRDAFRHARAQIRAPFKQWWMRLVLLPSGR